VVRRMFLLVVPFLLVLALSSVAAAADTTVMVAQDAKLGPILTDPKGMTVYLFTKDTPGSGTSACYGGCATAWPPLLATGDLSLPAGTPGTLATITRTDGAKQVTYNGAPLYYYATDKVAGDTTGQNVGKVWFVVTPKDLTAKLPATGGIPIALVVTGGVALLAAGQRLRRL
jgi:predicted lipoprotein with Yx(FWY)xxD motif